MKDDRASKRTSSTKSPPTEYVLEIPCLIGLEHCNAEPGTYTLATGFSVHLTPRSLAKGFAQLPLHLALSLCDLGTLHGRWSSDNVSNLIVACRMRSELFT